MNFRSIDDLNRDIVNNLYKIPKDIDLVVGIPRSGLLVANLISLYLNTPLVDLDGFLQGRIFQSGKTRRRNDYTEKINNIKKVLIVEDSVYEGASIIEVKKRIEKENLNIKFIYFAAYVTPHKKSLVDIYLDICDSPRVFEWNIMHHSVVEDSCFDLDGVLCNDPKLDEDDDGEKYINFIKNVKVLFAPTKKIKSIVTCRLEKYRQNTENWLEENGIEFENLIMMDYSTKEERMKSGKHAEYKAHHFKKSQTSIFFESDLEQAIKISKISKKPVYCIAVRKMIYPNNDINIAYYGKPYFRIKIIKRISAIKNHIIQKLKKFWTEHPLMDIIKD